MNISLPLQTGDNAAFVLQERPERLAVPDDHFGVFSHQEPGSESWRAHLSAFLAAFGPDDQAHLFLYAPGRHPDAFMAAIRQALPEGSELPPHVLVMTETLAAGELAKVMRTCDVYLDDTSAAVAFLARLRGLRVLPQISADRLLAARAEARADASEELAAFGGPSDELAPLIALYDHEPRYRFWREQALYVVDQLRRQRGRVRVLDYGASIGALTLELAALPGVEVAYLEMPGPQAEFARFRAERCGLPVEWLDGEAEAPLPAEPFDVIIAFDALARVEDGAESTADLVAHLAADGVLFVGERPARGALAQAGLEAQGETVFRRPVAPSEVLSAPLQRVLLLYQEHFYTTAKYFRKAFTELGFQVQVAGPGQGVVGGIELAADADLGALMEAFPEDQRPELVVYVDVNMEPQFRPRGLERLEVPTVGYFIDSHLNLADHLQRAGAFDHVGVSHGQYLKAFHEAGITQAFHLPCAADPDVFRPMDLVREPAVVFVGHTGMHPRRVQLLQALAERFPLLQGRAFFEACAAAFNRGAIAFNCSLNGDLNMRVFEAMAAGSLLVTDRLSAETGLETFFQDRVHLALYDDESDMLETVAHYLAHPDAAEAVRREARAAILAGHTYRHRALALLEAVHAEPGRGALLLEGQRRFAQHDLPGAIACFGAVARLADAPAAAFNNLGACTFALGRPDEARELFELALVREPGNQAALENLAALGVSVPAAPQPDAPPPAPASPLDGDLPAYYRFDRPEVRRLVPADARRVLDVGCAAGALGGALKRERPELEVVGIEYDRRAALVAGRTLDAVLQGPVEDVLADFPYPEGYFDCLVLADVLEHLVDPEAVLSQLLRYVREGGQVVLSLPNVRHYEVVGDLLVNGRWTYQDAGILDRTHLRFYTYREIEAWVGRLGLVLEELDTNRGVPNPQAFEAMVGAVRMLGGDEANFRSEASVIQYLLRLRTPVRAPKPVLEKVIPAAPVATPEPAPLAPSSEGPLVSIVVLTLNQLPVTQQCFESLFLHSTVPFELIVVDNGSTDGTRGYLRMLASQDPRIKVIANPENMGFAYGCNQGIAAAEGEYIVLLNNDTVLTEGWLEGLIAPFFAYVGAGAVGPRTNQIVGPQQLPFVPYGSDLAAMHAFARTWRETHRGELTRSYRLIGFCLALRRSALEKVGGLDPRFGIGNFEDDDLCMRLILAGYALYQAEGVFIHHVGHATFAGEKVNYGETMRQNAGRFFHKWELPDPEAGVYSAAELATRPFDPARHIEPILLPGAPAVAVDTRRTHRFLAMPDWHRPEAVVAAIAAFNQAFTADDDVSLLLWVDSDGPFAPDAIGETLAARLAEAGLDGEGTPELLLFTSSGNPIMIARAFATAAIFVPTGPDARAEQAAACGLAVLPALTPEAFREAAGLPAGAAV